MGLMLKYLQLKKTVVPDGIRKPFIFFRCLHALDDKEWKTPDKIALETGVSANTIQNYLRIAYEYGMVDRKRVSSLTYSGGRKKVYAYRLNKSHSRFKGVEW